MVYTAPNLHQALPGHGGEPLGVEFRRETNALVLTSWLQLRPSPLLPYRLHLHNPATPISMISGPYKFSPNANPDLPIEVNLHLQANQIRSLV